MCHFEALMGKCVHWMFEVNAASGDFCGVDFIVCENIHVSTSSAAIPPNKINKTARVSAGCERI